MDTTKNYTFYKFVCVNDDVNSCYVGSSADMKKRRTNHKRRCNNENCREHNLKIYKIIRENGGWSNWKIVEFATKDNITKREAERIEEEYRVQLKADMNDKRAFLSPEQRKEYHKEWYEDNPEYHKEYYEQNKEKMKEQMKEYYENNKKEISEKCKEYKENNKEKIKEKSNKKHDCPCGGRYTYVNKTKHFKTKMHQKYLGDCTTEANSDA
jgi:translation elongation factor EF-G